MGHAARVGNEARAARNRKTPLVGTEWLDLTRPTGLPLLPRSLRARPARVRRFASALSQSIARLGSRLLSARLSPRSRFSQVSSDGTLYNSVLPEQRNRRCVP